MNEEEEQPLINFIDKGGIAGYLNRNYKDKTIGKEVTPYVQKSLQILGDSYDDAMWKARRGMLGPGSFVGSHAIDTIGKIIPDIPIDKGISHVAHNVLGIDKPLADVTGVGGEAVLTRKGLNLLGKIKPKDLGITQTTTPYTKGLNPIQVTKPPTNVTDFASILDIIDNPKYSTFNRARQIGTKTTGSLGSLFTPFKSKQTANVENIMYTGGSDPLVPDSSRFSSDIDITNHPNYFKGIEGFPEKWQRLFLEYDYPERTYEVYQKSGIENKKFILDTWQRLGSSREAIALVGNPVYSDRTFEATRAVLLPDFLEELGNVPGIKPELHHIFSLRASAPLFDGLTVGSQKWKNLIRTLVQEGVYPGHNPQNLKLLADIPHDVVHRYLDDVIGRQGEIFFNESIIKQIQGKNRLQVARKYAKLVKNSEDILLKTQQAYAVSRPNRVPPATPEEIINVLESIDPYTKYTLDEIQDIIKEVDIDLPTVPSLVDGSLPQEQFTNWFNQLKRYSRWNEMGQAEQMQYLKEQTGKTMGEIDLLLQTDEDFNLDDILPNRLE